MRQYMKTEDEVMASYLLNGGKMLSTACKDCGAPMFDVKGKQCCVVCMELGKPGVPEVKLDKLPEKPLVSQYEAEKEPVQLSGSACESLELTICALCVKAMDASRPEDAKIYMDAVRAGTDALQMLKKG
jgi:UPF0148 protein